MSLTFGPKEIADCTILRGVAGSQLFGLSTPESDVDEIGICIEPLREAMGVQQPFEQWVSNPEVQDIVIYGLRKWIRLALKGNPTVMLPLFMPADKLSKINAVGSRLQ